MDAASSDYFRSGYQEDLAEIRRTLEPLPDVLTVFEQSFRSEIHGWPYSVSAASRISKPEFSNSTNAMIAFGLLAATGVLQRGVLLPLTRPVEIPTSFEDKRRGALRTLVANALETLAGKMDDEPSAVQLESRTFGLNDPFTTTWLVEVHNAVSRDAVVSNFGGKTEHLKSLADGIFSRVPESAGDMHALAFPDPRDPQAAASQPFEVPHPFPLLRIAQLREAVRQMGHEPKQSPSWMRERFAERLRRNLADHVVTDSTFDAADLVFSLEGMLVSERTPDEPLTEAVFNVIRESQERNAYWRPVKPFIATPQGHALLPLSIEVANSLLRSCHRLDLLFPERSFFSENLPLFKRYAQWLRSRLVEVKINGSTLRGWHSEHTLTENTIDLWETSQVIVFLLLYVDLLKRHVARSTLIAARLSVTRLPDHSLSAVKYWEQKAIPKEPLSTSEKPRQVYHQVADHFVRPIESDGKIRRSYSMLLYGPPGTGKTGIAEDLARSLRQSLITITPSDFLAEGPNEVEARAKVIFAALSAQADCVILFDEIDRLLLDRDAPMYHKQSDAFQFMTPSMLVKLKDLRRVEQAIFVIATNFYERIDPAARRTGRVDHRYLVMPPCRDQRRRIFLHLLKTAGVEGGSLPDPTGPTFDAALDQTALYGFGELEALVRDALAGRSPASGAEVATLLLNRAKDEEPTIRIAAYRGRFHVLVNRRDRLTEQEPVEEFVGLLELLEESKRLAEAGSDEAKILASIAPKIRNDDLKTRADRLLRALRATSAPGEVGH